MAVKSRYFEQFETDRIRHREAFATFEIFYRFVFTSVSPHCEASGRLDHDFILPAGAVSHITHNYGERLITQAFESCYTFKPAIKYGKDSITDQSETYVDTFLSPDMTEYRLTPGVEEQYKFVGPNESSMPSGYYSWWGIDVSKWLQEMDDPNRAILAAAKPPPSYIDPPVSIYGNIIFSCSLKDLLLSYQTSRQKGEEKPDVYILIGGTLRYTQQVNCVIIVCTENDRRSEALKDYQPFKLPIHDNGIDPAFFPNGLVDENGKVVDLSCASKAEFRPRYMSERSTWAFLVYALYFDNPDDRFKCSRENMVKSHIDHTDDICLWRKKTLTEPSEKWVCPNNF